MRTASNSAVLPAKQILHEAVERALAAVDRDQPRRTPAPPDLCREPLRGPADTVEIVAAVADDPSDHAPCDGGIQRKVGPERGQRFRSLRAQMNRRHDRAGYQWGWRFMSSSHSPIRAVTAGTVNPNCSPLTGPGADAP